MKTLKLIAIALLFVSTSIEAQVSVNVNIGSPPLWGPVGYSNVDYYYLPDVEAYYDIRASRFIYFNGGQWTRSRYLPGRYRNYNLYNGYKVVLTDYHGPTPYTYFKSHKVKYYKGYKNGNQKTIGAYKSKNNGNGNVRKNNSGNGNKEHKGNGNKGHGKGKN